MEGIALPGNRDPSWTQPKRSIVFGMQPAGASSPAQVSVSRMADREFCVADDQRRHGNRERDIATVDGYRQAAPQLRARRRSDQPELSSGTHAEFAVGPAQVSRHISGRLSAVLSETRQADTNATNRPSALIAGNAPLTGVPANQPKSIPCAECTCRSIISLAEVAEVYFRRLACRRGIQIRNKICRRRAKSDKSAIGADGHLFGRGNARGISVHIQISGDRLRRAVQRTEASVTHKNVPRRSAGNQIRRLGVKSNKPAIRTHCRSGTRAICRSSRRADGNQLR